MYYLDVISLEGCPYSSSAEELLKFKKVNFKLTKVKYNEREMYKSDEISTFPQIYLKKKESSGKLLIGGYDELKEIYNKIVTSKTIDSMVNSLGKLFGSNFNKKIILRLVELLSNDT